MKKNPLKYIDQENVKIDFKNHLDDSDNQRILFSARFGVGKSTFLKNYFENSEDYIALKLYPVNYSIAHNKDVFELIKYDLVYELLSKYPKEIQLKKDDYSFSLLSQVFILHNLKIDPLLKSILKASVPESDTYNEIIEQLNGIVKQYSKFKDDVVKDETALLNSYIAQLKNFKGTAHEHDQISELISNMLENVKSSKIENTPAIKTVLIIDDIDRLDPEHVFRLFNIFSAHYDSVTEENKFGFDKVIFVCDYDNIRLMYENRYGTGVDFSGYIDKFYSSDVFKYDNKKYVKNKLYEIFSGKAKNIQQNLEHIYSPTRSGDFYMVFEYILAILFEINALTLRNLEQFGIYDLPRYTFLPTDSSLRYQAADFPFLILTHLLGKLFSFDELCRHFSTLAERWDLDPVLTNPGGSYDVEQFHTYLKEISLTFIIDGKEFFSRKNMSEKTRSGVTSCEGKVIYYELMLNYQTMMNRAHLRNPNSTESITNRETQNNAFSFFLTAIKKSNGYAIEGH
ncbi:P-loop NTPase fold protein [Mucilaginibacter pedocola]|uniref:KAP NTPase domain-containing protein n=1 Tax=Mucilaginibacter pedocola TaxID=1792845 RepID=A0A1S9PBH8_9SPHI|nr:P-loop NTPase fold protein [Mucilaginibacter pedocola]OOQ57968.1 hypothetical protein BC343_09865 [Mucilaginibacter pedocola]